MILDKVHLGLGILRRDMSEVNSGGIFREVPDRVMERLRKRSTGEVGETTSVSPKDRQETCGGRLRVEVQKRHRQGRWIL